MTLPEPEKSESDAGEKANSSSGKSGSSKSASSKSEPKANTKASGSGGTCKASYYWQDQMTATGERFNTNDLTAAHKSLPFNSRVKVTNKANGKSVTVRINDRGPYVAGRCLDLSTAAMKAVGGTGAGVITVSYQVL
nr:septal ring lytic transglycosylase RlpA family protein [Brevibacterium ravenspurgense]